MSYVGQTNRRIAVRLEEHRHAVSQGLSTSSLAQHKKETGHNIDFKKRTRTGKYRTSDKQSCQRGHRNRETTPRNECQRRQHTFASCLEGHVQHTGYSKNKTNNNSDSSGLHVGTGYNRTAVHGPNTKHRTNDEKPCEGVGQ